MRVDPRYFTDPEGHDERVMLHGVKLARTIGEQAALEGWVARELAPGPAATSDDELIDYIHKTHNTVYHPACTARMGAAGDADAVVDPRLRVKGVQVAADRRRVDHAVPAGDQPVHHDDDDRREVRRSHQGGREVRAPARRCTRELTSSPPLDVRRRRVGRGRLGRDGRVRQPRHGRGRSARSRRATAADAERAIAAANRAFDGWSRLTAFERAAKMHAVGDAIERRRDELARTLTLDQGKPLHAEAYDEVDELVEYWRAAAEDGKRLGGELPNSFSAGKRVMLMRRARGVVGIITPWNWPYTMPAELLAPALACGNTVVWTPAPTTAMCAVALAECIAEADLPPGVVNLVTGPGPLVGDEIARNPGTRAVAFIGSTPTGRSVAAAAAGKAVVIEMGGNGPVVVMEDADVDARRRRHGGGVLPVRRPELHRRRADPRARGGARRVRRAARAQGDRDRAARRPVRRRDDDGPGQQRRRRLKMDEHVADAVDRGADIVAGGARADGFPTDLYWSATVLDGVPADSRVATEETFGPIAPVVSIASLDEAIRQANDSPYGLLAAIFTRDLAAGLRFADAVRTGWVNINELVQLLGGAPAVRRPRGDRQRDRARRRQPCHGHVHRAADGDVLDLSALREYLEHPRYEVLPVDGIEERVLAAVPREVKVTVTASPAKGLEATLAVAERLAGEGYTVVPHLSARLVRDGAHLAEIVARLRAAGIDEVVRPRRRRQGAGRVPRRRVAAARARPRVRRGGHHRLPREPPPDQRRDDDLGDVREGADGDLHRQPDLLRPATSSRRGSTRCGCAARSCRSGSGCRGSSTTPSCCGSR